SPDIKPLDFYLREYLQSIVYGIPVDSIDNLEECIMQACRTVQSHALIEAARRNLLERVELCVAESGMYFGNLHVRPK
ncbi:hypothetical protein WH47_01297, partial [Habropoda laboriosa]